MQKRESKRRLFRYYQNQVFVLLLLYIELVVDILCLARCYPREYAQN